MDTAQREFSLQSKMSIDSIGDVRVLSAVQDTAVPTAAPSAGTVFVAVLDAVLGVQCWIQCWVQR